MEQRDLIAHMRAAYVYAELSHCVRRKVGCVIVKNNIPISIGYNRTPPGWDKCCEDVNGKTRPEVIHAEDSAIRKLGAYETQRNPEGATVFVTKVPCLACAVQLALAKVNMVYYVEESRSNKTEGVDHLRKCGIEVVKLNMPSTDKNN